ncbi:hypothetical protein [Frigoribacterium endophyticum]|uniref:hypothetical protein n=1 Tax=Frigoribacterium endophyticum TaxID=1522176 RepID=UPI00141DA8F7|nr:hypothetical protein [Frigoribacterium endophyticum]NII52147.1 hypothetical protein [Frigoribacterium endophyticum]
MEMVEAGAMALAAAVGVAFLGLVAKKGADLLWVIVSALGRAAYWVTVGWWVNRIKSAMF